MVRVLTIIAMVVFFGWVVWETVSSGNFAYPIVALVMGLLWAWYARPRTGVGILNIGGSDSQQDTSEPIVSGTTQEPDLPESEVQAIAKLGALTTLSKTKAVKQGVSCANWAELLTRAVERGKQARSYCAIGAVKGYGDEQLKDRDYTLVEWRLDFVQPNRYHVVRLTWDAELGEVGDEWVVVGEDLYRNAGLWIRDEDAQDRRELERQNQQLSLGAVLVTLEALQASEPTAIAFYRQLEERFLLLEYKDPPAAGFAALEGESNLDSDLHIWISERTGQVVKAQLFYRGTAQGGDTLDDSIEQIFGCYNESVKVEPPKWLNAVSVGDGKIEIVDNRMPPVYLFGGSVGGTTEHIPASDPRAAALSSKVSRLTES